MTSTLRKKDLWVAALGLLAIGAIELWCHQRLLLQRLNPQAYYGVLVGEAGEARDRNDMAQAELLLRTAIREFPTNYWAYLSLGDTLLRTGDTNGAALNYELAVKFCGISSTNILSVQDQLRERRRIAQKLEDLRQ